MAVPLRRDFDAITARAIAHKVKERRRRSTVSMNGFGKRRGRSTRSPASTDRRHASPLSTCDDDHAARPDRTLHGGAGACQRRWRPRRGDRLGRPIRCRRSIRSSRAWCWRGRSGRRASMSRRHRWRSTPSNMPGGRRTNPLALHLPRAEGAGAHPERRAGHPPDLVEWDPDRWHRQSLYRRLRPVPRRGQRQSHLHASGIGAAHRRSSGCRSPRSVRQRMIAWIEMGCRSGGLRARGTGRGDGRVIGVWCLGGLANAARG